MIRKGERAEGSQRSEQIPLKEVEETHLYSPHSLPQGSPNSPLLAQGAAGCSGGPRLVAEPPTPHASPPCVWPGWWPPVAPGHGGPSTSPRHTGAQLCRGRGSGEIGFGGSDKTKVRGSEVLQSAGAAVGGCRAKTRSEGPGAGIPPVPFLGNKHSEHRGFLCTWQK